MAVPPPAAPPTQAGPPVPPPAPAAATGDPVQDVMAEVTTILGLMDQIDQRGVIGDVRFPTAAWDQHKGMMPMRIPPDQFMSVTMFYQTLASVNGILDQHHSGAQANEPISDGLRAQMMFIRQIGDQMALGALKGGGPKAV